MCHRRWFLCVLLALMWLPASPATAFVHPGLVNNLSELLHLRAQVNASAQPWLKEFNKIPDLSAYVPQSGSNLDVPPQPGGIPSPSAKAFEFDCFNAYGTALQWVVTESAGHANKSIQILNHLATVVKTSSGSVVTSHMGRLITPCLYAAEIMGRVYTGWAAGQQTTFKNWLRSFVEPRLGGPERSNFIIRNAGARMAIGVILDDQTMFDAGLKKWKEKINFYIGVHQTGLPAGTPFPLELCRTEDVIKGTLLGGDMVHTGNFLIYDRPHRRDWPASGHQSVWLCRSR